MIINRFKTKYPNIKEAVKSLPQNTFAQKVGVDLILALGKPLTQVIENVLENAVFESTPVDVNTEIEIKKLQLETKLVNAQTALLFAQKEHMEMKVEKQELIQQQKEKEEKEALEKALKLVADAEKNKTQMADFIEAREE